MTKSRRLIGIMLLACFALTAIIAVGVFGVGSYRAVAAEMTNVDNYYGLQLDTAEQKAFYQAMQQMAKLDPSGSSIFIRGEDYDLVANNHVTQSQLEAYANGDNTLLDAMGAARDAFYTDYDDIFYVDFEYLSLRVTQDTSGNYHACLGAGRSDTYWTKGFESEAQIRSAITEYQTELNKIVNLAKAAEATDEQKEDYGDEFAIQIAQIRKAHAEIAKRSVYRLESKASAGNEKHVRTPYGTLVVGEALCEGYSRAFKAVMDKLDVPCVLINGGYRHTETQIEEHMWTYVQLLDGKWYAVDMTFDDINLDDKVNGKEVGRSPVEQFDREANARAINEMGYYYSEEYFLKGSMIMDVHHALSPYKSAVQYAFSYPELSFYNVGSEETVTEYIKVVQAPSVEASNSTDIYISVLIDGEWCGHEAAAKKGYYFLIRYEGNYLPEKIGGGKLTGGDLVTDDEEGTFKAEYSTGYVWAYVYNPTFPEPLYGNLYSEGDYSVIRNESKALGFEVAVTTTPPRDYHNTGDIDKIAQMTTFTGDPSVFYARTGFLPVKYGDPNYQPAPHIVRATPVTTSRLAVGPTYEVKIEYDQLLMLPEGQDFQYSVYGMRPGGEILKGTNAVPISVITNVQWYGGELTDEGFDNSYVTFTFTPSKYFAHDSIYYMFDFNLIGVNSGKQVNTLEYAASNSTGYCSLGVPGYNWRIFGQPQLLEADDLSREGWIDSNGNTITNTKDRLALVVTTPSQQQNKEMNSLIENELGFGQDDVDKGGFESFTYNIQLTICKACVIKTGEAVRVSIGFPEGFTYDSWMDGVTFTMYHFIHDEQNNITGVEEIPITVTPLGLIIQVNSFSPFALVVTKGDAQQDPEKTVVIHNSNGGSAYATEEDGTHSKTFSINEGESRNVTIKANSGYVIQSIKINGVVEPTNFESTKTLTLSYKDLTAQTIIEVNFVAESVKDADESRGHTSVVQQLKKALISLAKSSVSVKEGERIEVAATVTAYGEANSYQWYKDGKPILGQTGKTLLIKHAHTSDAGNYTLAVTSKYGSSVVVASSSELAVSVAADNTGASGDGGGLGTAELITLIISLIGVCAIGIFIAVLLNTRSKKKNTK
ncbi:MAG: immunoglobulin domain-containing protein [Clostridiales bacterium]|nr:immunoglobulin domain-containing protein [Clostridiales bacterium]